MNGYLWIKAPWFAGVFYLPRIFVNLADVDDVATRMRPPLMARKLLRFMTLLALIAVAAQCRARMHAKLGPVALAVVKPF
jgi:putative membrane protein